MLEILPIAAGALLPVAAFAAWPQTMRVLATDLRLTRILHYIVLAALGMSLFLRQPAHFGALATAAPYLKLALLAICLFYAAIFAIVTNNVEDLEADRLTNPSRPLVQGTIAVGSYLRAGYAALGIALLLALWADARMAAGVAAISLGYWIYSCRPLRLKRIPILSKAILGANGWCVALTGWTIVGGDWRVFPWEWSLFLLVPLSLAANFVDLKDTEGDRATGIGTLPVLLGERTARHIIAAATLATYLSGAYLLHLPWVWPLNLGGAAVHIYLLYRQPYDERWVFLLLVGALVSLDFLLFLGADGGQ